MHQIKSYRFLLTVWTTLCIGSTCQGEEVDPLGGLRPIMNVPSEVIYQSDFNGLGKAKSTGTKTPATAIDKMSWQPRQSTRWSVVDGLLRGEQSTAEFQAQREHHHGYEPRIKSLTTPRQFIAAFSVRFNDGDETNLVPLIEFGHHNVRLKFSKTGVVLLADHEQIQLAKTQQVQLKSGRWYHLLAERQADEFVVQFAGGPTLYAKHKSLAIPVADNSDGLGIAGTRRGTVEIDNVTLWSIKSNAKAKEWNATVKILTAQMADPVILTKKKNGQKNPSRNRKIPGETGDTSQNKPWIKTFFVKNPSADADGDGILTKQEVNQFKETRKN